MAPRRLSSFSEKKTTLGGTGKRSGQEREEEEQEQQEEESKEEEEEEEEEENVQRRWNGHARVRVCFHLLALRVGALGVLGLARQARVLVGQSARLRKGFGPRRPLHVRKRRQERAHLGHLKAKKARRERHARAMAPTRTEGGETPLHGSKEAWRGTWRQKQKKKKGAVRITCS